ncbi:MAG: oligosaccharide flippase family protein, partial [Prevotella sp.]|nr:oligosaccharide flippase family protein [Prevotella sp.]
KEEEEKNPSALAEIIRIFKRLVLILAILGMAICIASAPLLSLMSFGDAKEHIGDFLILGVGLCFFTLSFGNITVLQGIQRLTSLAKYTIFTSILSLLCALPFYYFIGIKGIAYAITAGYVIAYLINTFYVKQLHLPKVSISKERFMQTAQPIVKLGATIMVSGLLINLFTYFTNVFIRHFGSLSDVGLYQGAFSLTNRNYAILSAVMVADFYPRLSALLKDKRSFDQAVNEQAELLLLVIAPISTLLIVFAYPLILLLLSEDFSSVVPLTQLIAASFVFRVEWSTLCFIALAHGNKMVYLVFDAIIGNGLYFIVNLVAYYFGGLNGLGLSCLLGTLAVSLLFVIAYGRIYSFRFDASFWQIQIACAIFVSVITLAAIFLTGWEKYAVWAVVGSLQIIYSMVALNKRLDIVSFIKTKLGK